MKRFADQNYYEILDIPVGATLREIQKAYEFSKKTYGSDAIASYSLFSHADLDELAERVEEAYRVLIDQAKRKRYDDDLSRGVSPTSLPHKQANPAPPIPDELLGLDEIDGAILRQIRGRKGISLQEIADKTRINITYLNYVEEDRYRSLPAEVYLKGYLAQYAQSLQCNPEWLVKAYLKSYYRWKRQQSPEESA